MTEKAGWKLTVTEATKVTHGFAPEKLLLLDVALGFTVVPATANNMYCWGLCEKAAECRVVDSEGATYYYCRACMLDHVRDKFESTEDG